MEAVLPRSRAACAAPTASVLWQPSESDAAAVASADAFPATLALVPTPPDGDLTLRLCPLPDGWNAAATAAVHTTWDDGGGRRGERAAHLLRRLRACGEWQLYICRFLRRSSFAGLVFSPHIDLVALPHKITQPHGRRGRAPDGGPPTRAPPPRRRQRQRVGRWREY